MAVPPSDPCPIPLPSLSLSLTLSLYPSLSLASILLSSTIPSSSLLPPLLALLSSLSPSRIHQQFCICTDSAPPRRCETESQARLAFSLEFCQCGQRNMPLYQCLQQRHHTSTPSMTEPILRAARRNFWKSESEVSAFGMVNLFWSFSALASSVISSSQNAPSPTPATG